jgi:hypothetical protein
MAGECWNDAWTWHFTVLAGHQIMCPSQLARPLYKGVNPAHEEIQQHP